MPKNRVYEKPQVKVTVYCQPGVPEIWSEASRLAGVTRSAWLTSLANETTEMKFVQDILDCKDKMTVAECIEKYPFDEFEIPKKDGTSGQPGATYDNWDEYVTTLWNEVTDV